MLPVSTTMNRYHDKRRRIDYFKIKKMLNLETSGSDSNSSKSEMAKKDGKDDKPLVGMEKILSDVHLTSFNFKKLNTEEDCF